MPRFEVWTTATYYEKHTIEAEDERDAFWRLMLEKPLYDKHVEHSEVYRVERQD